MSCKGVDLTHPRWLLARANVAGTRLNPPDQTHASGWPAEMILDRDRPFWKEIDRKLRLDSLEEGIPDVQEETIRPVFEEERTSIDRKIFGNENKDELSLALAFPYGIPPVARKCLHHLFGPQNLPALLRPQRSAIEAPVALAVEGVAQNKVALTSPAHVLLLTGGPPSLELAAATLSRENNTLRIEITGYAPVDDSDLAGTLRRLGKNRAHGPLFHTGLPEEAETIAGASGQNLSPADVVDLGRHAAAVGAIRFGGMLRQQFWVGNQIGRIEVERSAPVATGVLGTNGKGEWFWRRIIDRGTRLKSNAAPAGLRVGTSVPDRVALAECPHPDFASRRWLSRKDWAAAGLCWHDVVSNQQKPADWDLQFKVGPHSGPRWNRLPTLLWEIVPTQKETDAPGPKDPELSESR